MHYEDDGVSQAYPSQYATTRIVKNASGSGVTVEIGPCEGSYAGKPVNRKLSLVLGGASRCPKATLNGQPLECQYNADTKEAGIFLPATSVSEPQKVVVKW